MKKEPRKVKEAKRTFTRKDRKKSGLKREITRRAQARTKGARARGIRDGQRTSFVNIASAPLVGTLTDFILQNTSRKTATFSAADLDSAKEQAVAAGFARKVTSLKVVA